MEYSLHGSWWTPPASQQCLMAPLGPTARPLSGIAAGCSLSEPSQVAGPSGSTGHMANAIDPVCGSQWSASSIDTSLPVKQGATVTGSYRFASTGEVSTGTASSADAARQPSWHGSIGPNGSTGPARGCHLN